MKKKVFCMFAGLLLLLTVCAACGKSNVEPDTQEDAAESAQQETQQTEQTTQEASEEPEYPEWSEQTYGSYAEAYADLLDQWRREEFNEYSRFYLIYLDDDDVPELVIPFDGTHISGFSTVVTFSEGKWVKMWSDGVYGWLTYDRGSGLLLEHHEGMGGYSTECYQMNGTRMDYLTEFFYLEPLYVPEDVAVEFTIKIDEVSVSKEELCAKWDEMMAGRELYDTDWDNAFELTDENFEALKTNPKAFLLTGTPSELQALPDWAAEQ